MTDIHSRPSFHRASTGALSDYSTAVTTETMETIKELAGRLVHPYLDAMSDEEAFSLVEAVIHPGAKFYMQGKPYEGKQGYLKYRQVVRNAWKRVVITNDRLYIETLPEQDRPQSHKQVKVCWTVEGLRSNAYLKDRHGDDYFKMAKAKLTFSGISLYTFDQLGKCVQGMNSYNANVIVEQLQDEIHKLSRLQLATVEVRAIGLRRQKVRNFNILEESSSSLEDLLPKEEEATVSGTEMILTVINSMTGDFFLAIPYGMQQAGVFFGTFLICLTGMVTCYTALLIVRFARKLEKRGLAELSQHFLGLSGFYLTHVMNLLIFLGTCCANFVFLKDNFLAICALAHSFGFGPAIEAEQAVGAVALLTFALVTYAEMNLLVQLNSLAAICSVYILFWQLTSCCLEMHTNGLPQEVPGYPGGLSFGVLPGMMTYTLLLHGWVLPVVETLADKSRANWNIVVAVAITVVLLIIAGSTSILAFGVGHSVPQNFLTDFNQQKMFPFSAVIALTIEALIFTPLMLYLSKETLQEILYGSNSKSVPGAVKMGLNATAILFSSMVAILYPNVGNVMGWVGAFCGLLLGFIFPSTFLLIDEGVSAITCLKCAFVIGVGSGSLGLQIASALS